MQLTAAACYALFTVTLTATCILGDDSTQSLSQENTEEQTRHREEKRITKREAALIIDSFPSDNGFEHKSKVIYRRVTRLPIPYRTSRPQYAPKRTKSVKSSRPIKHKRSKYHQPSRYNYNYGPPKSQKKRPPKSKSRSRQPIHVKPVYSIQKHRLQRQPSTPYRPPEPTGFAEPPVEYHANRHPQNHRPTFSDPPVDSYGAPLTAPTSSDVFYNQGYPMESNEHGHVYNQVEGFQAWDNDQHNIEPKFAYTQTRPAFAPPDPIEEINSSPADYHDFNINNYADTYKHENSKPLRVQKHYNRHWTPKKPRDHVIVGGQYAEPPGRYVPNYPPIAHHEEDDEEAHFGPMHEFDTDASASGTISSYVNYKNSNMAFSPQNLNDAFSIVD